MYSSHKAIAIGRSRALVRWVCWILPIGWLLPVGLGLRKEARAQVIEVPSRSSSPNDLPPLPPSLSVPGQQPATPPDSPFPADMQRLQLGPSLNIVPTNPCPECGQGCPESGPLSGPLPGRPGGRLEGLFRSWFDPPERYRGPGQPLLRESWLYRPYSFGWFMGVLYGGELVDDWVTQKEGYLGGFRLGWDFHHYWGCEMRLAWGYARLEDSQRAKAAQTAADDLLGLDADDPFRNRFDDRRDMDLTHVFDFSFLYYPWGDSAWRPYFLAGVGYVGIAFEDRLSTNWQTSALGLPLGVGLKYRWNDWLVLRFELNDTLVIPGHGIKAVNEFSFNGGVEIRFGGARKAYWPWNPGLHYW